MNVLRRRNLNKKGASRIRPENTDATRRLKEAAGGSAGHLSLDDLQTIGLVLVVAQVAAACYGPIADCDEVYNYWEPLHYVLYGSGFQTWEYSPAYGLRSYVYILLYAIPARIIEVLIKLNLLSPTVPQKVAVFYGLRIFIGLSTAMSELYLVKAVAASFRSKSLAWATTAVLATSAGLFQAGVSFLPQTFAMFFITLSWASWIENKSKSPMIPIVFMAIAGLIGWPFVAFLAVPMAADLVSRFGLKCCLTHGIIAAAPCIAVSMIVDFVFYKKVFLAVVNIAIYNGTASGANIYGVEPWFFYLLNLMLNFSFAAPLLCLSPVISLGHLSLSPSGSRMRREAMDALKFFSPVVGWVLFFSLLAHKEERFLYAIYPLMGVSTMVSLFFASERLAKGLRMFVRWGFVFIIAATGLSRCIALSKYYGAPLSVYASLAQLSDQRSFSVCVGKEWYRFPSSFFLPSPNTSLRFIKSGFSGQLPKPYDPWPKGTWVVPTGMNDQNREEFDRYVDSESQCDYVVDLDLVGEQKFADETLWTRVASFPFLDATRSSQPHRSFWLPFAPLNSTSFNSYSLYKRYEHAQS